MLGRPSSVGADAQFERWDWAVGLGGGTGRWDWTVCCGRVMGKTMGQAVGQAISRTRVVPLRFCPRLGRDGGN